MNNKDRNQEILRMHKQERSLKRIGARFNLSGERVRQILVASGEYDPTYWHKKIVEKECKHCKGIYETKNIQQRYCSRKCASTAQRFSVEEKRAIWRSRSNKYYHKKLKNDPEFIRKRDKRNLEYYIRTHPCYKKDK